MTIAFADEMFYDAAVVIAEWIKKYSIHDNVGVMYFFGGWCCCCLTINIVTSSGDGIIPIVIDIAVVIVIIIVLEAGRNLG